MNKKRPVNLDLRTLSFPPMAIASILHRLSGVFLFFLFPFILYMLHLSLANEAGFQSFMKLQQCIWIKLLFWMFGSSLLYHLFAGIRHLLMDLGWGESLCAGRKSALFVMGLSVVAILFLGYGLW